MGLENLGRIDLLRGLRDQTLKVLEKPRPPQSLKSLKIISNLELPRLYLRAYFQKEVLVKLVE